MTIRVVCQYVCGILLLWGFLWGIFCPEYLWLCLPGMVLGIWCSKDY